MTNISSKLWFAGEHVHPNQSSNVHGAFQTGLWAGQAAGMGLWQLFGYLFYYWLCENDLDYIYHFLIILLFRLIN
jgi:hypothetical protein